MVIMMKFWATPSMGIGTVIITAVEAFFFGGTAIFVFINEGWSNTCLGFIILVLLSVITCILLVTGDRRKMFSTIQFDEKGIRHQLNGKEGIFIPWGECRSIGVYVVRGKSSYYYIYFSNAMLTDKEIRDRGLIRFDRTYMVIEYRSKVLVEITKYIDESEIKGLELIKKKRKIRKKS